MAFDALEFESLMARFNDNMARAVAEATDREMMTVPEFDPELYLEGERMLAEFDSAFVRAVAKSVDREIMAMPTITTAVADEDRTYSIGCHADGTWTMTANDYEAASEWLKISIGNEHYWAQVHPPLSDARKDIENAPEPPPAAVVCPYCGTVNPAGALECGEGRWNGCGAPLVQPEARASLDDGFFPVPTPSPLGSLVDTGRLRPNIKYAHYVEYENKPHKFRSEVQTSPVLELDAIATGWEYLKREMGRPFLFLLEKLNRIIG